VIFYISYYTPDNKKTSELFESHDHITLLDDLAKKDIAPSHYIKLPGFFKFFKSLSEEKITAEEAIEILDNLYLITRTGIALNNGLKDLAQESTKKSIKNMMYHILYEVESGESLSSAFKKYTHVFGNTVINLVQIGEQTGKLAKTLKRSAEFLKQNLEIKRKIKSALITPSISIIAISLMLVVWMTYVLPKITGVFAQMNLELPWITLLLMDISAYLQENLLGMSITLVALIMISVTLIKKVYVLQMLFIKLLLKTPLISTMVSYFNIAFISEFLELSISSGVPLYDAVELVHNNTKNIYYKKGMKELKENLEQGKSLSMSLKEQQLFTNFAVRVIAIGESTGTLDEQLQTIYDHYYEKVSHLSDNVTKIIQPIITVVAGFFFSVIIIGAMSPMYELIGNIQF
jgi:type II secretory pathway component PulF